MRSSRSHKTQTVGVISDTHGLLRPEVLEAFQGVSLILHAGDIGSPEVIEALKKIAPVIAVRGNNDTGAWAKRIPEIETVRVASLSIHMIHDLKTMKGPASDFDVVISGHSHKPSIDRRDGVLFLNPGSAGPRRFKLPICVARLNVSPLDAELIAL
jgi:putative phosphoesterase